MWGKFVRGPEGAGSEGRCRRLGRPEGPGPERPHALAGTAGGPRPREAACAGWEGRRAPAWGDWGAPAPGDWRALPPRAVAGGHLTGGRTLLYCVVESFDHSVRGNPEADAPVRGECGENA
ncbi:MAG: hypothetical protein Kow00122_08120 [Thermoleophilia bacterium]